MATTAITNGSTAREIAASIGCSLPTVMAKAKTFGFRFKGRSEADHRRLMDALGTVRPRPRRTNGAKRPKVKVALGERIAAHLAAGRELAKLAEHEVAELLEQSKAIEQALSDRRVAIATLKAEQESLGSLS